MPELFSMNIDEITKLKKFKYLACTSEDLWNCINYLYDQIFRQFRNGMGARQLAYFKCFFNSANIEIK